MPRFPFFWSSSAGDSIISKSRGSPPPPPFLLWGRLKNPSLFDEGKICQIFPSFFKKSRRWCQGFFSHDPLLLRQSTLVSSFSLRRAPAIKKAQSVNFLRLSFFLRLEVVTEPFFVLSPLMTIGTGVEGVENGFFFIVSFFARARGNGNEMAEH